MKVKEFINLLKKCNQNAVILVSCDEELNVLFKDIEVANLNGERCVIYGLSGSEVDWICQMKKSLR